MRNEELFRRVAHQIEEHPHSYKQTTWGDDSCGTQMCIAGHAASLAGYHPTEYRWSEDEDWQQAWYFVARTPGELINSAAAQEVTVVAGELLGLTEAEASVLFDGSWKPAPPLTVPEALEKLAVGAPLHEVSSEMGRLQLELDQREEGLPE